MQSSFYLRRTIGSWSGGTQVEIIEVSGDIAAVEIQAGEKPIINGVPLSDIVERRREKSAKMSEK